MTSMGMRAHPARGYPGRTYRFYKGPVVFPFGHGLSYTTFSHKLATQAPTQLLIPISSSRMNSTVLMGTNAVRVKHTDCDSLSLALSLEIDIENTGPKDGTHSLLLFAEPPNANKQLVAFRKVHLGAGIRRRVAIAIHVCKHLSVVDQFGIRRIPMGQHTLHIGDHLKHSISFQPHLGEIIKS